MWFTETTGNRVAKITTTGVVTEYSAGISAGAGPRNIWPGPDGNVWFTETAGNGIGMITTAGVVTEFVVGIAPASQPWNIVTGPDGILWFTEYAAGQIGKITTAGAVTEYRTGITLGAAPNGIAAGPDGNLWFTEPAIGAIGRITPLGIVTEYRVGISTGSQPMGIAAGPDGNMWFAEFLGDRIGRITPSGVVTEFAVSSGANPWGIARGPDNNMWFTGRTGDRIGRIVALPQNGTVGTVTEFSAGITAGSNPESIAAGPDGNLWFTEASGNRIGRITPLGGVTEFGAGITPGGGPRGIAAGPDGNLWFTEVVGSRIGRITPLGVVTEFNVGLTLFSYPEMITAGPDGNMWFTEYLGNRIGRIVVLPANGTVGTITEFPAGITPVATPEGIAAGPDGNLWFTESNINRVARITTNSDFVVTNKNDSGAGSLRDAIAQANVSNSPSTITFGPAVTGTIVLTSGQLIINRATTIAGPGAANLTIDGNANNRIFSIFATDPACPALDGADYLVSISGLRLANARRTQSNGGGAIFTEHSLTLDSMLLDGNIAAIGGGLYAQVQYPGQTLTIINSQFANNRAQPIGPSPVSDSGGAMVVFERCAGVHVAPIVNISGSVFTANQVLPSTLNGFGGAIHMDSIGDVTIVDTRIVNNQVVLPDPPVATQIYRSGGMHVFAKSLRIERSEISDNSLLDATGSDLTRGGGMVAYNTAADLQGAGDTMNAKIVNSTISGNSSPATAGAMLISGNVAMEFDNSTVSNNTAPQTRTGGIALGVSTGQLAPTLTVISSILANNSSDGGDVAAGFPAFPTFTINATNSLIEKICPSPACEMTVAGSGNLLGVDPMLGPLVNNGGPTRTQPLLAGSPAINVGSNPLSLTTDQRGTGFPRVIGGTADMGAHEYNPVAPPVLANAISRRVHGAAGTFNLSLTLVAPPNINHNPTTEPRQGPAQTIVFTFDKAITGATATVTEGIATAAAPTISGNDVVVALTGVIDRQYVTVSLTNVASVDGGTGGVGSARVGFLVGDVNQSRVVSVADLGLVNTQLAQSTSAANYLKDVNASGSITIADKGVTNANLTKALGTP